VNRVPSKIQSTAGAYASALEKALRYSYSVSSSTPDSTGKVERLRVLQ